PIVSRLVRSAQPEDAVERRRRRGGPDARHDSTGGLPSFPVTVLPQIPTLPSANLRLPPQLEGLARIAYNLYWSWNPATRSLFHRIDDAAWRWHRNPIPLLHIQRDWTPF